MIIIEWSEHGTPHVLAGSGPPLLSDFLATDVQDYWPRIEEITTVIERCRRGEALEPVSFYGNVYELKLGCEKAILANLFDASIAPESHPFSDFKVMFEVWVAALRSWGK